MDLSPAARDVLLGLFESHGVSVEHGPAALAEAEAWAKDPEIDDPGLEDFEAFPFVTLDSRHAMDLDQALHVEPAGDGHVVRYAIADASHYVRPGTALWTAALERGASCYLPGLVAPMLPRVLSEDVVSLNPEVARRAVVFVHRLDKEGVCTATEVVRARIRSRAKLSFEETQAFLDGGPPPRGMDDVGRSIAALQEVGRHRVRLADERGVVRFRRAEVVVAALPGDVPAFTSLEAVEHEVENHNEQLSLLCNVEGARLLQRGAPEGVLQPIYRAHPPPTDAALAAFQRLVGALVRAHGKPPRWRWRRGKVPLAEYLAGLPDEGADGRLARTIHRQALLVGGRAEYTEAPATHHGIGAAAYARFSAPMREIVGVFCHKELLEALAGASPHSAAEDEALREEVIRSATAARTVQGRLERAANRLVIDGLLGTDAASGRAVERAGTLMGLGRGKAHVRLDDPPIDLKIYVRHLEGERGPLRVGRDGVRLFAGDVPVLTAGERVTVSVLDRDDAADRWRLRCAPA